MLATTGPVIVLAKLPFTLTLVRLLMLELAAVPLNEAVPLISQTDPVTLREHSSL